MRRRKTSHICFVEANKGCKGLGCNVEEKYYLNLGSVDNDDRSLGIVFGACVKIINMTE